MQYTVNADHSIFESLHKRPEPDGASAFERLTRPDLVAKRRAWEKRLADRDDTPLCLRGVLARGVTDMSADPQQRMQEALSQLADRVHILGDEEVFRPLSVCAALHGVHFVDKLFGADVYELENEPDNWQTRYLTSPIGSLARPNLDNHPTWAIAKAFARAFVDSGVTVPVFMLPTVASALNIGMNLYGQELLMAMMLEPEAAQRDLQTINDVLIEIHDWYRATVPIDRLHQVACGGRYQPPGCGQICGCSTQMIACEQYEQFIAQKDDAVLSRYPNGGMIHLCGSHTQHIPVWKQMKSLTAVQVNDRAAEDLEIYLREMSEKVYYVAPCEAMPRERIEQFAIDHKIIIVGEVA